MMIGLQVAAAKHPAAGEVSFVDHIQSSESHTVVRHSGQSNWHIISRTPFQLFALVAP